jgi:ribose-phosphate pyrophosphokinase
MKNTKIFSGNANPRLAAAVAEDLCMPVSRADVTRFSDGEIQVELRECVRRRHVVIVQPTSAPANDNLMELLLMADAARRSGAKKVTALIPYYGYSRQDRRPEHTRAPLSSRVVADMIQAVGVHQVIIVDMHSLQQVGFFNIPVVNVSGMVELSADIWRAYGQRNPVVVSPDIGGTARARSVAKELGLDLAVVDKRRQKANDSEVMNIIGDVSGRVCVMVDDMVDTAGTLCKGAKALKDKGATAVAAYATHAVLSGGAYETLGKYGEFLDELVVTDTVPLRPSGEVKIRVVSVARLLSQIVQLLDAGKSISEHLP